MSGLSQLLGLPLWIKGVLGMSTLGLLTLGAAMLGGTVGLSIVAGGVVLIAVLLLAYRKFLKLADKRKSSPFMAKLRENSAATPQGVSDPSHRAQLDDMRKKFEHGLEIFKEHGKDLYSMPWYLLVGEPGSGKTEMVRRCNVGFPPGLQDTLQGTGGTVNMHWWFTNHAVILDTAGKLMFEDAPAGQTTVWKEFLKQLRVGRPNCPVNGMLLVIPADTLIVDSADEIQRKAGKIAEQLDAIQRALGVRFPVFVVITKCDKINGFKEFFDSVRDPQLQHQILGWSNPEDLDAPFNPEHVDQHLATVQQRLRRRRMGLLIDPVHTEDPNGRRIDQVDAMYALPDSIMQVAPRLRRYLETIFVAGEWSSKPLFLRGIYFNSALREGDALDADLAAMFSVPVDALPEGKVWERERSYFIRDLLMNKVFKEKGLVTRASNTKQLQRQRLGIVMGAAIAAVVLSIGLLVFSGTRFKRSVGQHVDFWRQASKAVVNGDAIAPAIRRGEGDSYELAFRPASDMAPLMGLSTSDPVPYSQVISAIAERSRTTISVPVEFRWIRMFGGADPSRKQVEAAQTVVDSAVLRPLIDGARRRFESATFAWQSSPWSGPALAELVRVERDAFELAARNEAVVTRPPEVEPLLRFLDPGVNPDSNEEKAEATTRDILHASNAVKHVYMPEGAEGPEWPSDSAGVVAGTGIPSIVKGLDSMRSHWGNASSGQAGSGLAAQLAALERASLALNESELGSTGLLLGVGFENATTLVDHTKARDQWRTRFRAFQRASAELDAMLAALGDRASQEPAAWVKEAEQELLNAAESEFKVVLDQMPDRAKTVAPDGTDLPTLGAEAKRLVELGTQAEEARSALRKSTGDRLREMEAALNKAHQESLRASVVAGASGRLFQVRQRIYETLDAQLFAEDSRDSISELKPSLDEVEASTKRAEQQVAQLGAAGAGIGVFQRASEVSRVVLEASQLRRRHDLIASLLDGFEREEMARLVSQIASELPAEQRDLMTPPVPLNALGEQKIDHRYHPIAARAAFSAWNDASGMLAPRSVTAAAGGGAPQVLDTDALSKRQSGLADRVGAYVGDYAAYWMEKVLRPGSDVRVFATWAEFRQEILNVQATDINESLDELLRMVGDALTGLPKGSASTDELIQVALDQVQTERAFLTGARQRDPFRSKASDTLKGLFDLGPRAADARRAVLGMTPRELRTRVLAVYAREDQPGVAFWNQLVLRGLSVIVDETAGELEASVRRLIADGNRVPLSRGASGSPMGIREFQTLLGSIESLASSSATSAPVGGRTIGEGEAMDDSRLDPVLDRMSGQRVLTGRERQEWFAKLSQVASALGPARGPLSYTISVIDPAEQSEVGYRGALPYVRVQSAGRTDGPYWLSVPTQMGTTVRVEEGATLTLEFAQSEDGPWGGVVVQTPAGWTLAAWAVSTGKRDASDPLLWKVPIDVGGDRCLIGIRFSRELPSHEQWPTPATWPR